MTHPNLAALAAARAAHAAAPTTATAAAVEAAWLEVEATRWWEWEEVTSLPAHQRVGRWADACYDAGRVVDACAYCGVVNNGARAVGAVVEIRTYRCGYDCYQCGSN